MNGSTKPARPDREGLISVFANECWGIIQNQRLARLSEIEISSLSLDEAYSVQERVLAAQVATGMRIVGWKVGCTSASIQQQFGLTEPISARLLQPNIFDSGATLRAWQDCAVEAELAFRIGQDLSSCSNETQLRAAITTVHVGIELHRFRFWYGEPTSQELIVSNGIHSGLVIGPPHDPGSLDLNCERMQLIVNGNIEAEGLGRNVMGGPLQSLSWLARHAEGRGQQVRAGDLVIPGSAVRLIRVGPGDIIESRFASMGSCFVCLT